MFCVGICVNAQSVKTEADGFKWSPYLEYGRIGAKTPSGKIIVPAKYSACYYERGHFSVKDNVGHTGVFSKYGKCIVPTDFLIIYQIKDYKGESPYIVVGRNGYGLYSQSGKLLIPPQYLNIEPFVTSKGVFYVVMNHNSYSGITRENGEWIIAPTKYNHLIVENLGDDVYFSYLIFGDNRCSGVLDIQGREMIFTHYSATRPIMTTNGELHYQIQHGLVSKGTMDSNGNIILAPKTEETYLLRKFGQNNVYIVINEKGLWGIANENKVMQIPCKYDFISLTYPYFSVRKGQYMGLYDEKFKSIIKTSDRYTTVAKVDNKIKEHGFISAITAENKSALFDLQGKKLSDANHQHITFHIFNSNGNRKDTVLIYSDNGLWGCEDLQHRTIFPARYQDLNYMETPIGNFFYVFQNNLVGLCNAEGIEIINPQYSGIDFKRTSGMDYFLSSNGEFTAVFSVDGTQLINGETFSNIYYDEKKSQFIAIQGNRKCYFSKDGILLSDNALDIEQDKYISLADDYFERGKYRAAAKNYGLAINIKPTASLYFNRGVSYYNMNKYNEAIADFRLCLDNNPSKYLITRSHELIDKAEEYQFKKEQNRAQMASAIFGLVLTGANAYFQIQAQKQRAKYTSYGTSYSSSAISTTDTDEGMSSHTSTSSNQCPSLKVNRGKWYCANTGQCGMCGGDGLMDDNLGGGVNRHKCTLCGGSGKCKYCQ